MPRRLLASLMAVSFFWAGQSRAKSDPLERDSWDCGTFALYHLLHMEGRPTDLDRVGSALGSPRKRGRSFRELREAARRCGLTLDAVVLPRKRSAMTGPVLLFVKAEPEGHFVVVRPVGHTGRLIQWLDGDRTPVVLDAEWLFASASWTGLALVPRRTNYGVIGAMSAFIVCLVTAVFLRSTGRNDGIGSPPVPSGVAVVQSQ